MITDRQRYWCEDELAAAESRIAMLEADLRAAVVALVQIGTEVEPVRTRRVRRNGSIKALVDAVLSRPTVAALREEG